MGIFHTFSAITLTSALFLYLLKCNITIERVSELFYSSPFSVILVKNIKMYEQCLPDFL